MRTIKCPDCGKLNPDVREFGHKLPKDAQVRMCGNSVCPPLSRALVAANYAEQPALKAAA